MNLNRIELLNDYILIDEYASAFGTGVVVKSPTYHEGNGWKLMIPIGTPVRFVPPGIQFIEDDKSYTAVKYSEIIYKEILLQHFHPILK